MVKVKGASMNGTALTAGIAAFVATQGVAAELLTNVAARKLTSLDGRWQAIVDPFENGYYDYRLEPLANGFFKNEKPIDYRELAAEWDGKGGRMQ